MQTWLRLAWRMQRIELTLLGMATLGIVGGSLWLASQLDLLHATGQSCLVATDQPLSTACQRVLTDSNQLRSLASVLGAAAVVAPVALGLFLGTPLVAREIEHRTAGIAWSLSLSRRRWLIQRLLPLVAFVVTSLVLIGLVGDRLEAARGGIGFARSFLPWPLLVARGLWVFAVGLLVGALVGRTFPAFLLAGVVCLAIFVVVDLAIDRWMETQAVPIVAGDGAEGAPPASSAPPFASTRPVS